MVEVVLRVAFAFVISVCSGVSNGGVLVDVDSGDEDIVVVVISVVTVLKIVPVVVVVGVVVIVVVCPCAVNMAPEKIQSYSLALCHLFFSF